MAQTFGASASAGGFSNTRAQRLLDELKFAVERTDRTVLAQWAVESARIFGKAFMRRVSGLAKVAGGAIRFVGRETFEAYRAAKSGNWSQHVDQKRTQIGDVLRRTGQSFAENARAIVSRLRTNPREAAPELLAAVLGFYIGSGGLDANGGIPDKDIAVGGIGSHRSVFTHSLLTGTLLETAVFSVVLLANAVYVNLPEEHDEFWDRLIAETNRLTVAFAAGACAGLAYHLLADATWQAGKPYADLPLSLPHGGHELIMGGSAVAEGIRAGELGRVAGKTRVPNKP